MSANQPPPLPSSAPRKRRGCLRFLIVAVCILLGVLVMSRLTTSSGVGMPIFGRSVGVVRIEGPISDSTQIVKIIRGFRENSLVKAIVLRVDSPGGAVGASEEIYREALKARETDKKVVVASMGNVAASGGYYVSCAAQEIYSNGGTITGSIGVIMLDWNVEDIMQRLGVESVVVKSGRHKDSGSPFREMTPEDRSLFQGLIFDTYRQFCTVVLRARHKAMAAALRAHPGAVADALSTATTSWGAGGLEWEAFTTGTVARAAGATTDTETLLRWIADGRVLTGDQALTLGLVDKIGTLDDAVVRAGMLAGLGPTRRSWSVGPSHRIPSLLGISAREFWQEFSRREPERADAPGGKLKVVPTHQLLFRSYSWGFIGIHDPPDDGVERLAPAGYQVFEAGSRCAVPARMG